jgi:hypothetical protein
MSGFLSEAIDEMGVDTVWIERPGYQIAGAHPSTSRPFTERHTGSRRTGRGGHHLDAL